MAYPPPVIKRERKVLEIIARGHPERRMNFRNKHGSGIVNSLSWSEIQISSGFSQSIFSDCIAHLVANNLIASGTRKRGFFGGLVGRKDIHYFWVTESGLQFLRKFSDEDTPDEAPLTLLGALKGEDIDEAVRIYENSFSEFPYVKQKEIDWANQVLDEDIRYEIKIAAIELEKMWTEFERMFGHRSAARSKRESSVRDPAVVRSAVRVFRAQDEQRCRKGFGTSWKPEAWSTHYNNGDVRLDSPPW